MDAKTDQIKGRVEEAVGALTNDQRLKNQGKIDQAAGKAKEAIGNVIDKATAATKAMNKK